MKVKIPSQHKIIGFLLLNFLFLFPGCATKSDLTEKVDAKGVYDTPNQFEMKKLDYRVINPEEVGQRITQSSIKKKNLSVVSNIFNVKKNQYDRINLNINLRAQVFLYEYKSDTIRGACYSKSHLELPGLNIHNVFLYGKKIESLSQLHRETNILQFQTIIPDDFSQNLDDAIEWCWSYVYYLDQPGLISGYSAIISSLAFNVPSEFCSPLPVESYASSADCRSWFKNLPVRFTQSSIPVCATSAHSATSGRCELRAMKNSFCPYLANTQNQRAQNAGHLNELTSYTKFDMSGQRLLLCPEGGSICRQTATYKFTKLGKKIDQIFVCR